MLFLSSFLKTRSLLPFLQHGWRCINAALFIAICSLLICNCDLFTKPKDPDYLKKIDEEIAWANAAKLNVTVAYPNEWGSSPQFSGCFDAVRTKEKPRKGYPFNVEFTPNSGFGFITWLAFEFSEDLRLDAIKDLEFKDAENLALKAEAVKITPPAESLTGAFVSSVTVTAAAVTAGKTITLVPFCSERPRITQSNPPLINSGFSYTRGQEIRIWMNLGYSEDKEFNFGEDSITVFGQNVSDGSPWNGTGDLQAYYEKPVYEALRKSIVIKPNSAPPQEENYPPGNCTITVTVGTGIIAVNGKGMAAPVSFSYRTSSEIVTRAYKASNVWAIHNPNNPTVGNFFYQTASEDRDRRLRKNSNGNYEITLYFGVSRSMGEIEDPEPDSLSITEVYYTNLSGTLDEDEGEEGIENMGEWKRENDYTIVIMESFTNSAGGIYRQMNPAANPLGVYYYKAVYTFNAGADAGIYRLVVLPWRSESNPKDQAKVGPDDWEAAVAEGRFVTVVIDNDPPGGSGSLLLSGQSFVDEDGVYAYTSVNRFININPDFSKIQDNGEEGGILLNQATPNLPWTMDDWSKLLWQWRIIGNNNRLLHESPLLAMGSNPPQLDINSILEEPEDEFAVPEVCTINVKFSDALGNECDWEDMGVMGKIIYVLPPDTATVTGWSAVYNESNDTIFIQWSMPSVMDGVSMKITDTQGTVTILDKKDIQSHTIFNVPKLIGNGKNLISLGYHIELTAYKEAGGTITKPLSEPILIYNYPGMVSNEANPIIGITNATELASIGTSGLGPANANKQYFLVNDITLSSACTPIGNGDGANSFQGKFYGNGKRITVSNNFAFSQYNGVFGYIRNALIRDLEVFYSSSVSGSRASETYLGGIAGYTAGSSALIDCEVSGGPGTALQFTVSSAGDVHTGGISGCLSISSQIINCTSSVNVTAIQTGNGIAYAGGLAGSTGRSIGNNVFIQNSGYTSSLVSASGNAAVYAGGLLGQASRATIQKCYSTGNIEANNSDGVLYAGGLIANPTGTNLDQSWASGNVTATRTAAGDFAIYAGGLLGLVAGSTGIESVYNNLYALGDVFVHNDFASYNHPVYAGGLFGLINSNSLTLNNGFAVGKVSIKSSHTVSNTNYGSNAGGVFGRNSGTANRFVALGSPVTATMGASGSQAYRIGTISSGANAANNYALDSIQVGTSDLGYNGSITWRNLARPPASEDGADVSNATRRTAAFWTGTGSGQMGFDPAVWDVTDITGISSRGYPLLRDVGE